MTGKRSNVSVLDDSFMAFGMCQRTRVGPDGVERRLISAECFFAEEGRSLRDKMRVLQARIACSACPVKDECLEFALAGRYEHGVWAATTPEERLVILSRRNGVRVKRGTLVGV